MHIIEHQKTIAAYVMKKLEIIDPNCILAGGAPRDWELGIPANDLDFYYYTHAHSAHDVLMQLNRLFGENTFKFLQCKNAGEEDQNGYLSIPYVDRVLEGEIAGIKVQMIKTKDEQDTYDLIRYFDLSICQIWWKNGASYPNPNFLFSLENNVIFESCKSDKTVHKNKIIEQYSDRFMFLSTEAVKNMAEMLGEPVSILDISENKDKGVNFEHFRISW